ncbi:MAG: MBL fold metallo-hydrolase [Oscillospiraceae bacterium]|nr:MBL fold metallo-hydrolase [Oscillospiraceae bacterium]
MIKFCSLFSSSKGNCTYIGGSQGGVLIDAGVSCKQIELALWDLGVSAQSIRGIFLTHEHIDHIRGLRVFAKKHGIRAYATSGTINALEESRESDGSFELRRIPKSGMEIGEFFLEYFPTSHDTAESCGYRITLSDGRGIGFATDLGTVTNQVLSALRGCEIVLLESNHDVDMLRAGPYPYFLQQRILSDRGHLSNAACAETVACLVESGVKHLVLGHLSDENNHPALAYEHTKSTLQAIGAKLGRDFTLDVATGKIGGGTQPVVVLDSAKMLASAGG